jgi:hypothetical protein
MDPAPYPQSGEWGSSWFKDGQHWRSVGLIASSETESLDVSCVVHRTDDWWLARVVVDGRMVHTSEHEGRDQAMRVAGQAAMRAVRLRVPLIQETRPKPRLEEATAP